MKKQTNRQRYRDIFDQIKLSDEGYRQIRNMEENTMIHFNHQNKKRIGFRVAVSLAACAIVLLSANGIAYAATGSTLIEQVAEHVSVYVNGKPYPVSKISKSKDKNGNTQYRVSIDDNKDSSARVEVDESQNTEKISDPSSSTAQEEIKTSVKQINDTIYLILEGISEKPVQVDITKDYADGEAKGIVPIEGGEYQYCVKGTVTEYSVDLEKK